MAVSVQPKIAGLDVLESGLRTLKRSKLLVTPEYKDMLFAVERHHNDLRLAHLTGKAKDLLEQAQRDTKFYNILVKMLCEVKEKRTGEQRQGLRRVYTWYMANKHVLYTGPHFGKEQLKKEAHEVLVKASTPRKAKSTHTKSTLTSRTGSSQSQACAAGQKSRAKSAPSTRITWRDSSFDWRKDLEKGVVNQEQPKVERLNLQDDHDDNDTIEPELQRLAGDTDTAHNTPLNTADTATTANTELLREARRLSRAHHESPTTPMTPLGEQSPNVEVSSVTPAKMIHSISSMVNPHVTLSLQLEQQRQEKQQAQRRMGEKQSRAHSLQAWQNFNKNRSYGQDIVDRLNFVGRSGTPNDVRYFAHGQAEMPELYTSDVITGYAQVMAAQTALTDDGSRPDDQKENVFVHQTLEQFYETADSLYPSSDHRPMSRSPRVKSAPVAGRMSSRLSKAGLPATAGSDSPKRRVSGHPPRLGHMLQDFTVQEEVTELKGQGEQTTVKLDTVINIIDSVSEEMTLYKERLAPEAQAGFRQPVATGLPVGASSPPSVRLPSPVARSNSPVQEQTAEPLVRQPAPPRPYSSPSLLSRQAMMREGLGSATTSPRLPKDRCKSAGVIDWRGRVQPDTTRYKWGKTKFGGYTYLKKHLQRPSSLRTAGSTSAGRRPKTAPVSIREKWKTERASDANSRVEGQAASNSMTQINQQDVDSMMTVHYLLGSSNSRADSMASLFSLDEEFLRNFHRRHNVPSSAPPLEYMSFVASSPAALLQAERRSTSHDLAHQDTFDERPRPEAGNEGADYIPLPPNLDDLHLPLDDLIAENNNDDDDSIAGEAGEEEELLDDHLEEKREDKEEDGAEGKQEEGQQTGTKPDVITSDVSNTEHDPVEATSDRLPAEEASDVLLSQNTTAGTEVTSDKAEVIANVPTAVEDTISNEQAPVYGSSEVTPANDLVDVTPVSDPTLTTSDHDSAKATCVSISTQVTQVYDQSETELTSALSDKDQAQTEVKGVTSVTFITPDSKSPLPGSSRQSHRQPLSVSQVWQFSPSEYDDEEDGLNPNFILGPSGAPRVGSARPAQRRKVYCSDCISMASTETATVPKIQRSAGRMPTQAYSTSAPPLLHFTRRHDELMRRVPPPRTPPSIPMPKAHSLKKERSPRGRPMMTELEHHARKVKSPRALMQHVKDLRSSGDMQETPRSNASTADSLMSTLQVCRLQIPLPRQRTVPLLQSSGSDRDCLHSILKQPSEHTIIIPHQQELYSNDIAEGTQPTEKVVTFSQDDSDFNKDSQPENTSTEFFANGLPMPDSMGFMRQFASEVSSLHSSGSVSLHNSLPGSRHTSEPGTPSNRNLAHVGRPIPQVAHIPDPDEVAVAVQKQKEAAAAVDIQRLFRGYVARNIYKKLLTEERATAEDKQRAAVEIQRMYRGHLSRRRAIKHRAPNKEMLEWAHNYRQVLLANEHNRQAKAEERAEQLASNYHNAQSKLSVIGPHVNIYEIYHPKKTGPSKKELNVAAIAIQRWIRGWLIRRRFDKLKRKAAWYGSTFEKLVKEYKAMLSRVQSQHGMNNPKTPFTTREMNDYIDIRRRYECIFEKKAFGGELELADVPSFFKECDLFPSQAEIDEALDVAVRGVEGRGLKRHEMLNMVFYIYTPSATGLQNTRQSTWMNPIIDGIEAKRLIGSEFVEDAPLEVCAQLVIESRRERREKEQAEEQARSEAEDAELRRQMAASRRRVSREGREKEKVEGKTKEEKEEK